MKGGIRLSGSESLSNIYGREIWKLIAEKIKVLTKKSYFQYSITSNGTPSSPNTKVIMIRFVTYAMDIVEILFTGN